MMEAKNGYNNPKPNISPTTEKNYYYRSAWIGEASKIFAKPILKALQERKQNKKEFIKEINESGLNYTYSGFVSAMAGKNPYCVNFTYFIKLYEYLELPFPSLQYLSSFD